MDYILQTHSLYKSYKGKDAVKDLNMNIKPGDIYGFLGLNGAGKTTVMRMIMGLIKPSSGSIELFGSAGGRKAYERIGSMIEYPGFYPKLSGEENLEIHRRLMGMGNKESVYSSLKAVGLAKDKSLPVRSYSLGMKQRLGIARALLHNPELLILDEPTNGLDPAGIRGVRDLFMRLSQQRGITFLISSHILSEMELFATKIGIIHHGALIDELDSKELKGKTRACLEIHVSDAKKAAFALEQKLNAKDYQILGGNAIKLYELLEAPQEVNACLMSSGIGVSSISLSGDSLEDYFLKLTGGPQ